MDVVDAAEANGLCCPECRGLLTHSDPKQASLTSPDPMADTLLVCEACDQTFPVIGGIARFVTQQHLASFGFQWNKYDVAHDAEDRATFLAKTGVDPGELRGLRVLDAGCGGGRYSKLVAESGAVLFAADHSTAVEKATELCGAPQGTTFVQADLKRLPFPPQSFDFAFSIGVMHHDANTRAVFDAVAAMVKPGGRMSVWLYRRNQWWQEAINNWIRRRTVKMSAARLERWSRLGAWFGGVPIVNRMLNKIINFSAHPNWSNRVCDTFDWYAPQYQYHHTIEELREWFASAGFTSVIELPPEKTGRIYRWAYRQNLLIGSGVNMVGTKREDDQ